jgi:hypothetical protein
MLWNCNKDTEYVYNFPYGYNHRLSNNKPTKRGKDKSLTDGHYQCKKDMEDQLLTCQQFLTESHIVTRHPDERASL